MSLDLASFELVRNSAAALQGLLAEGLVDVVLANEEEVHAFGSVASGGNPLSAPAIAAPRVAGSGVSASESPPQPSADGEIEAAETVAERGAAAAAAAAEDERGSPAERGISFPGAPAGVQQAQELLLRHCRVGTHPRASIYLGPT